MMGSSLAVSHNRACNFESPITRFKLVVGPLAFGWNRALFFLSFTGGVSFPYTNYARNPRDDRSQNPPPTRLFSQFPTRSFTRPCENSLKQPPPPGRSFTEFPTRPIIHSIPCTIVRRIPPRSFTQSATRSFTRGLFCFYTAIRTLPYVHDCSQNNLPTQPCEQCSTRPFAGSFTQPLTRAPLRSFTQPPTRVPLQNHRSNNPPGFFARCPALSFAESATQDRSENNLLHDCSQNPPKDPTHHHAQNQLKK